MQSNEGLSATAKFIKFTILVVVVVGVLLVTVVMPSQYGTDPTGIGRVLGLTQMGEAKMQLAEQAAADAMAEDILSKGKVTPPYHKHSHGDGHHH